MKTTIEIQKTANQVIVIVRGILDDTFQVSASKLESAESVLINMQELKFMNSAGIRQFVKWASDAATSFKTLRIVLTLVPPSVAKQLFTVARLLPSAFSIDSVYLPYYCNDCELEDRGRLVTANDVAKADPLGSLTEQKIPCSKCSKPMEFDGIPEHFIGLLK